MAPDRQALKQKLFTLIQPLQKAKRGAPLTNRTLPANTSNQIEALVTAIEALNPNLSPLLYSPQLLDGNWLLNYSTAREIRSLDKLPLGLKVGRIYQIINVPNQSFLNQAFVYHPLGLAKGYVKVTAKFEIAKPAGEVLPDKRINVEFLERIISVQKLMGVATPQLDPAKVVPARSPEGRIPFLEITYLDEDLRIGRGGEGSLFVLSKVSEVIP
ncbi:PAP/fibrillin family protein [Synechocystis sp. FACHB-383]|nr:PAP/fibrillin family protein [Synechocystis sp. FACHB-383]